MDFFGLGSATEMETPLGLLVKSATDPLLLGPDWAKNLEICDSISSLPEAAAVIKAIHHQLKSSDPKVVQLALTLTDTCVQNSWTHVPQAIYKGFMDEIGQICRGRRGVQNQEEALRLVQVWGRRFEQKRSELPIFFDTYMSMRAQGADFPPEEAPAPTSSTSHGDSKGKKQKNSASSEPPAEVDPNVKITGDLNVVLEQVRLCREMLPESVGIAGDDLLAEVVGFLEACQGRMLELVEAGTNGLLSEEVFEECLRVNDAIAKTLEAEKDGLPIAVDDGTQPIGGGGKKATGSSDASSGLTTSLLDDDIDEFASLTMKTSTKKASGGSKKIPAIRGPGTGAGSKAKSSGTSLLVPPPSANASANTKNQQPVKQQQQQQQQQQQPPKSQESVDLDFLGGGTDSNQAPPLPQPSNVSNNPFDMDETSTQSTPSSSNPLHGKSTGGEKASTLGSAEMTDEEFESFLNK